MRRWREEFDVNRWMERTADQLAGAAGGGFAAARQVGTADQFVGEEALTV